MHLRRPLAAAGPLALSLAVSLTLAACADRPLTAPDAAKRALPNASQSAAFPDYIALADGFSPEGIEAGRGTTLFVGSIPGGAIVRVDARTGARQTLVAASPTRQASGLEYDGRTDRLFVAGGMTGQAYVYDATTGALVTSIHLYDTDFLNGRPSLINDAALGRDAVWLTDSFRAVLYRVPLAPNGAIAGPAQELALSGDYVNVPGQLNGNGIELSPDGKTLIMVNSTTGQLYRVDQATGVATIVPVAGADQYAMSGGDGLLLDGRDLYVVQGFVNRVAVVRLSPDLGSGAVTRYITNGAFDFPSTIAEMGGSLYAVNANFDEAPPPPAPPSPDAAFGIVRVAR